MKATKARTPLEHVQRLIRKLSTDERKTLVPFLSTLPDSGIQSYNLKEELDTLKKFGTRISGHVTNDAREDSLFELVFVRNLVSVQINGVEVLRTVFLPDNFRAQFPKSPLAAEKFAIYLNREFDKRKVKASLQASRKESGIEESDEEFEVVIEQFVKKVADERMKLKAEWIAEQITLHLPGMVSEMFGAAYKAQAWVDTQNLAKALGKPEEKLSNEQFKKLILSTYWRSVKPHLNIERNTRTKPEWRNDDALKQYARLVSDRKSLTSRIKEVYEDCDFEAGWMNDLKEDSTYQRLSVDAPQDVLDFAMKRVADDGATPREREPLSVACEMARRELALPEQDIETLRTYYTNGSGLLKKERTSRSDKPESGL